MVRWFLVLQNTLGGLSGQKTCPRRKGVENLGQGAFKKLKDYCCLILILLADLVENHQLRVGSPCALNKELETKAVCAILRTS
jgi:hypothetical protein